MIRYHLGCGKRDFGESWIHVDGSYFPHIDSHDIGLYNMKSDSADLIYASHLIAYFDKFEISRILKQWLRVLKPGGILRIATPDFMKLKWVYENTSDVENILGPLYGRMQMGDGIIYHKTTYTFKSITALLEGAGFKDVSQFMWQDTDHAQFDDHSQAYFPHMEKGTGMLISLNVECQKL